MRPFGASACKLEDKVGSIEEGLNADIIATDGNPLDNFEYLSNVSFIMKDGKVYKKPEGCQVEIEKTILN